MHSILKPKTIVGRWRTGDSITSLTKTLRHPYQISMILCYKVITPVLESKIAMTVPVSTWVSLTSDGKEEFREMAFFLGQDQQEKPLKPTNDKVYLRERPGVTVFTRFV